MKLLTLALFAMALNMDSFAVGVVYGVRKIKMPPVSLAIICLMSMGAISISMLVGGVLAAYFSPILAHRLGGIILLLLGLWVLFQSLQENKPRIEGEETDAAHPGTIIRIHIRSLGLAIQILREPSKADLDRSGIISAKEAVLLGFTLALDAFAAGFAISLLSFGILPTALMVGIGQFTFTYLGLMAGMYAIASSLSQKISLLSGFILITLGFFKIY